MTHRGALSFYYLQNIDDDSISNSIYMEFVGFRRVFWVVFKDRFR